MGKLRFNMKVNQTQPIKKAPKRQLPAPVKIEQCQPPIPDELFTPGGNFVLQTPAELKEQSFFPIETSKPEAELIKTEKEFIRQDSFSEYFHVTDNIVLAMSDGWERIVVEITLLLH